MLDGEEGKVVRIVLIPVFARQVRFGNNSVDEAEAGGSCGILRLSGRFEPLLRHLNRCSSGNGRYPDCAAYSISSVKMAEKT